jgi:hypothetical protein
VNRTRARAWNENRGIPPIPPLDVIAEVDIEPDVVEVDAAAVVTEVDAFAVALVELETEDVSIVTWCMLWEYARVSVS